MLQYSTKDAGSAATDQALKAAMQKKECTWISVTSSDNAYGSKVMCFEHCADCDVSVFLSMHCDWYYRVHCGSAA
jgi:hypothetical protein